MTTSLVLFAAGLAYAQPAALSSGAHSAAWVSTQNRAQIADAYSRARAGDHPHRHENLSQWFRKHENLPPAAQEKALRAEPGFSRLSPRRQQRLLRRLRHLDAMPPERRERTLRRMEAMEKLSPEQRRQVRRTMRKIMEMPQNERQRMREAFHRLTYLPSDQRQAKLNSPEFKSKFSDRERRMLNTLMSVQPYRQGPPAETGVPYRK